LPLPALEMLGKDWCGRVHCQTSGRFGVGQPVVGTARAPYHSFNTDREGNQQYQEKMREMEPKKVREIIRPFRADIPLNPYVTADDKITQAIRLMLIYGVKRITVIRNNRPIGFIRLEDAFEAIGLLVE
jgi:CBS domain-containing protein